MIKLKDFIKAFDNEYLVIFDFNDEILIQGTKKELINQLYYNQILATKTVNHYSYVNKEYFITINYIDSPNSEYVIYIGE